MKHLLLSCMVLIAIPGVTLAQPGPAINGIRANTRVFNDFTTTTLVPTNSNSVNAGATSTVNISETNWTNDAIGGTFANRHDFLLSPDSGVSAQVFSINHSFTVQARVTLSVGSNAPRKEAGFRIDSPVTGDALFLINSDAGEIVAFGGPFKSFGNNAGGNGYTPGTSILMGMTMRAAGDGNGPLQNTLEYFIDRGAGRESSGLLPWTNLEGGPVNFSVAMFTQSQPNLSNAGEFVTTNFTDIRYAAIPEPSTIALGALALLGLANIRRRSST